MSDKKKPAPSVSITLFSKLTTWTKRWSFMARFSTLACAARANTTPSSILATSSFN